jgi:nicotinamide mononucleotide transporter
MAAIVFVSAAMVLATGLQLWPISWTEVFGFITGGICVWLVVREHLWNWPIGLANNVVFFVLFWQGRLYADAWLQVVYFGLGVYGWWNWLHGGPQNSRLIVSRAHRWEWLLILATAPFAVWGLRSLLIAVQGAAPLWDSLTTVLSLVAQVLLCRKRLEHWLIWIAADLIYVPLYISRGLPLTAVLYVVFLLMCLVGWMQWWRQWKAQARRSSPIQQATANV